MTEQKGQIMNSNQIISFAWIQDVYLDWVTFIKDN